MNAPTHELDLSKAPDGVADWLEFVAAEGFTLFFTYCADWFNQTARFRNTIGAVSELLADRGYWEIFLGLSEDHMHDWQVWRYVCTGEEFQIPPRGDYVVKGAPLRTQVDFFISNWNLVKSRWEIPGVEVELTQAQTRFNLLSIGLNPDNQ